MASRTTIYYEYNRLTVGVTFFHEGFGGVLLPIEVNARAACRPSSLASIIIGQLTEETSGAFQRSVASITCSGSVLQQ